MILPNRTREEEKIRNADDKLQARLLAKQQKLSEILKKLGSSLVKSTKN